MDSQPVLVPQWLKEANNRQSQTTNKNTALPPVKFQDKKLNGFQDQTRSEKESSQRNYKHILSRTRSYKGESEEVPAAAAGGEVGLSNGLVRSISVNSSYPQNDSGKWTSNRTDFKQTLSSKWPEQKTSYRGEEGELIEQTLRQRTKLLIPRVKQSNRVKSNSSQPQKQRTTGPIALKFVNAQNQPTSEHNGNFGLILKRPDTDYSSAGSNSSPLKKPPSSFEDTSNKGDNQNNNNNNNNTNNNNNNNKLSDRQNFFKNLKSNSSGGKQQLEDTGADFTDRELQFLYAMGWKKGDWENCEPLSDKEIAEFQASSYYKMYLSKRAGQATPGKVFK